MMFVNYTPSFPEPRTIQKLPAQFRSTTLPPKPPNPHPSFSSPQLPARPSPFITPTYTVPASLQTPPLPNLPSVPQCTSFEDSRRPESQTPTVRPNDLDKAFQETESLDNRGRTVVDLTADTASWEVGAQDSQHSLSDGTCDPADILRRDKDGDQDQDDEAQLILDPTPAPFTPKSAEPLEPLAGTEHSSPVLCPKPPSSGPDKHPDREAYQELSHGSREMSTTIEAETNTKIGCANSTCSLPVIRPNKPERPKDATGVTSAYNTGQRQYPFRRGRCPSDAGPMQTMVAVVIPAAKMPRGKRHRPEAGQKSGSDHHSPGHAAPVVDQSGSDTGSQRYPFNYPDNNYAANSSDASDFVKKQPSKRRKLGSRSTVTTSGPAQSLSQSRPRPQIARAVKDRRRSKSKSLVIATRSASSEHTRFNTALPHSTGRTLGWRFLSNEDISALVSGITQKFLEYRRDPSPSPTRAVDDEEAVMYTQSASDSELRGKPDAKRPRWTQSDDEFLVKMKAQGWRWWEIEQQFPHRTKASLQQRWSLIHRSQAMEPSSATATRTRKGKCKLVD